MGISIKQWFWTSCMFLVLSQTYAQDLEAIRTLIFKKTNELRMEKGLQPFKHLDSLDGIAQYHSDNMVSQNFYAHTDHEGLNPVQRAEKLGVLAWRKKGNMLIGVAENIAMTPWFANVRGCGDTQSAEAFAECMVQGWKKSPPHYKNILGDYVYLGVGIQFDDQKRGFGTQNFR